MTDIGEYLELFKLSIWHQQNVRAFIGSYKLEVCNFSHALTNLKIEINTGILMAWGISRFLSDYLLLSHVFWFLCRNAASDRFKSSF